MKDVRNKTVCFTGHRELKDNISERLYKTIESLILQGFLYFGAGGARGFDALASATVLQLKKKYPEIHLILVLPFINQYNNESGWSEGEIKQYHELKAKASKVVHLQENYSAGCYYRRNRHLVDFSGVCVCYQYKNTGGTAYTTEYARSKGNVRIINII